MASSHIYTAFDEELKFLTRRISEMGGLAEQMVSEAVQALVTSDSALAQKVIADDAALDLAEREVGDKAIIIIARRQPVAADLREIIGSLRIAADLERVGDLGKNTAKRVIAVQENGVPRKLARGIEHLSELALIQLKEVLDVYTTRSAEKAKSIRERDEEIDAMYTSIFRELLTYMMEDPRNITPAPIFCSAPRISSASAITPPTLPKPSTTWRRAPSRKASVRRMIRPIRWWHRRDRKAQACRAHLAKARAKRHASIQNVASVVRAGEFSRAACRLPFRCNRCLPPKEGFEP